MGGFNPQNPPCLPLWTRACIHVYDIGYSSKYPSHHLVHRPYVSLSCTLRWFYFANVAMGFEIASDYSALAGRGAIQILVTKQLMNLESLSINEQVIGLHACELI